MADLVITLLFDGVGAVVAGRLRALQPTLPTGLRRAGTKPEQRPGWVLDVQIAACAWARGHTVATDNRRDFDAISDLVAALYPSMPALEIIEAPARWATRHIGRFSIRRKAITPPRGGA